MTTKHVIWFWIGTVVALVAFLWLLSGVLLPFVAGLALAYMLDPLADRLERRMPRVAATGLILGGFFAVMILALLLIYPMLAEQVLDFIHRAPSLIEQVRTKIVPYFTELVGRLPEGGAGRVKDAISSEANKAVGLVGGIISGVIGGGAAVLDALSLFFITPIVAFYLIRDWDRLVAWVDDSLPRAHAATIREQVLEIDQVLSGFVRGQLSVCLILGIFYAVALSLIGLDFGLVIGLLSGALTFIPYAGAFIGLGLTAIVAVIQFWQEPWMIAVALGVFALGQFVEGNIISPTLVGDKVGLHPVLLIFALLAFGSVFGFVGVLLAVPAAAVVGVLVRFAFTRYRESHLYHGGGQDS